MEEAAPSDVPSVFHDADVIGQLPRRFVLIDDYDDENGEAHREISLFGLALASGECATLGTDGCLHGSWSRPESPASLLGLNLVWLDANS